MFPKIVYISTLCVYLGLATAKSGYHEHSSDIQNLINLETIFLKEFETYLDKVQQVQDSIKRFVDVVEVVHEDIEESIDYFGNPLNVFSTINRLVNNWQREVIDVALSYNDVLAFQKRVNKDIRKHRIEEPHTNDLLLATGDLLQFQNRYNIITSELAQDALFVDDRTNKNVTLSASDCLVIGRGYQQLNSNDLSIEWLLESNLKLSDNAASFEEIGPVEVKEQLVKVLQRVGNYKLAQKLNNDILRVEPEHEQAKKLRAELENQLIMGRYQAVKPRIKSEL